MHWVLQDNLFNETAYQVLLSTLERLELPHSIHKVIPFVGEFSEPHDIQTQNVICMGSYSLRHIAAREGWNPGVFDLEDTDFPIQLQHWGNWMLNADSVVTTFGAAHFTAEEMFVRPVADSKSFAGQTMSKAYFDAWQKKICRLNEDYGDTVSANTLIQLSPLKRIQREVRCWVVRSEIVTASLYREGRRVVYRSILPDDPLLHFARERIQEWQPHDAFVIDVCDSADGMKVVEINTLNSCGFYAADIPRLVMSLEDAFNHG